LFSSTFFADFRSLETCDVLLSLCFAVLLFWVENTILRVLICGKFKGKFERLLNYKDLRFQTKRTNLTKNHKLSLPRSVQPERNKITNANNENLS
jgi:hypothetical protein